MLILFQVRVNKEQDHVLISPQGLSFAEVTAANLVSIMALLLFFNHECRLLCHGSSSCIGQNVKTQFPYFGEIKIYVIDNPLNEYPPILKFKKGICCVSTVRFFFIFYFNGSGQILLMVILDVCFQHMLCLPDLFPPEFLQVSRCIQQ